MGPCGGLRERAVGVGRVCADLLPGGDVRVLGGWVTLGKPLFPSVPPLPQLFKWGRLYTRLLTEL